jgi:hypothetical protein
LAKGGTGIMRFYLSVYLSVYLVFGGASAFGKDVVTGGGKVGLFQAKAGSRYKDKQLDICEMGYAVGFEDYINRKGEYSVLTGSITLWGNAGSKLAPLLVLNVLLYDLDAINRKRELVQLNDSYLAIGRKSYDLLEAASFPCDQSGLCVRYDAIKYPELTKILERDFDLHFQRDQGPAMSVPVNLARDAPAEADKFSACVAKLVPIYMKRLSN